MARPGQTSLTLLASGKEEGSDNGSRSVRRAIDVLELLLQEDTPLTVAEIIVRLAIPKSTAYELIRTLTEAGYLERNERGSNYFLGRKLFELGMAYRGHVDLLKDGAPIVEALRDVTGETVQLSVLENGHMLVLLKEEGSQSIRIISRVGSRVPVNWAAAGRLLVSDLDDEDLRNLLVRTATASPTGNALTDVKLLVQQIRRFRKQGYATELNEANAHAGCVSAPVVDGSGRCVAAISVVAPEHRLGAVNRQRLINEVRSAALGLSRRLGAP
jgi:IclR family transcriptional regulator, KDG regulon repressor